MSDPNFSDQQEQPDSSRPIEQLRPVNNAIYRIPSKYSPPNPKQNNYLAKSTVRQYQPPPQDPATQMLTQLKQLLQDYNSVMVKAKRFFGKYLPHDENHFMSSGGQQLPQAPSISSNAHRMERPRQQQLRQSYYQPAEYDTYQPHGIQEAPQDHEQRNLAQSYVREVGKEKKNHGFNKKTKNQDPNKPKSPLTPYFLFFSQTRDILRQKYPEKSLAQIGALGGSVWRQLSESERQQYKDRYEKSRLEYIEQLKHYNGSDGVLTGAIRDFESTNAEDF